MAAYRRVYDLRHLQAYYQEPGSAPDPCARYLSMGYFYLFIALWFNPRDPRQLVRCILPPALWMPGAAN